MLKLTVKVGQEVQLGENTVIKVFERKGQAVTLGFVTAVSPITVARGILDEPGEIELSSPGFVLDADEP